MARRKKGGAQNADEAGSPSPEAAAPAASVPYLEASDRIVRACASMGSAAQIAIGELQTHAAPFLSFSQKATIAALGTNFETLGFAVPAPVGPAGHKMVEGGLSREQIEEIVASTVDTAINRALLRIGATADDPIRDQVERQVDSQVAAQEHRLLEYVKKHLTESLKLLEGSLDDRLGGYFEDHEDQREAELEQQRAREEVDKQVEEAKDNLLQSIDEVRSVDLGFDISEFADGLSEVVGADQSIAVEVGELELGEDEDAIEIEAGEDVDLEADEDIEIEAGEDVDLEIEAGEDVDLEADEDIDLEADEDIDLEADEDIDLEVDEDIDLEADEDIDLEAAPLEVEADTAEPGETDVLGSIDVEDSILVEGEDEDDSDSIEIEIAEEGPSIELGEADPGLETVDRSDVNDTSEPITLDLDVSGTEEVVEIELGDDEDVEIEITEDYETTTLSAPEGDESFEEISVIREGTEDEQSIDVEVSLEVDEGDLIELELGEVDDDDDNPSLITLGTGPDDIESISVAEISSEYDLAVEKEEEEEANPNEDAGHIERYLQRAAEMRARKQSAAAMELYSKVLDLDADNYEAHVGRGVLHLEAKDYKRSVDEFTRAEKIDSSRPAGALGLAEVHFHRKQFSKAIRHYTRCLKLDDKLAQAYCNRGLSYYYQKNYKKAFLDLMKAYDLDSELPKIKKYLKLVRNKVKTDK
jgi:tetratricopeptide (TPR) repeat protein